MKTEHTPGPWYVHVGPYVHSFHSPDNMVYNGDGKTLAHCREHDDAVLMAAAPEMLAALKAIASCLSPEDNDYAAQKVREAIRKAEGNQ